MSDERDGTRREFVRLAIVSTGLLLTGCGTKTDNPKEKNGTPAKPEQTGPEVTATEDLMREHGVLRRALLVYDAAAKKLRARPADVPPDALQKTAKLFRDFGEDYHEKKLEEAFIFPAVKNAGGPAGALPDILVVQHQRGREVTDYILAVTQGTKLGANNAEPLAKSLESMAWMYQNHSAREDTILFPAWKATLTDDQFDDMSDKFEDIEHEQFGEDGYENAVKQISDIEAELGLSDLGQFTAPAPPKV
jgi:hemerythrin-like domain-containing protein